MSAAVNVFETLATGNAVSGVTLPGGGHVGQAGRATPDRAIGEQDRR